MSTDKQTSQSSSQLDDLQGLLEKQIKLARQGNISKLEVLSKCCGPLVDKVVRAGILESVGFGNRREQLQKLYRELHLTVTAQKAEDAENLSRIRKGKKTIQTYHNNI